MQYKNSLSFYFSLFLFKLFFQVHTKEEKVIIMKRLKKTLFFLFFLGLTLLILCYGYAMLHPLQLDQQRKNITIYDRQQHVMYESNFKKNMEWANIEEIPSIIQDACISVEDKRFYSHMGFDPIRIGKALLSNLANKQVVQGGSTITQQYAKNLFLTNEQTISRKIQEFFYSARLEMQYSKEDILEGYLNTIYYGHGIYGIQSAAKFFFDLPLNQLSIAQIAMLIGIPNGPSLYSPFLNLEQSLQRQKLMLEVMYQNQVISEEEYTQAKQEELTFAQSKPQKDAGIAQYYIDAVLAQLQEVSFEYDDEIRVYTYYDETVQSALHNAIVSHMDMNDEFELSAVILEPFTSHIMAMNGGKNYTLSQYNRALYSKRQAASTIKPLLYYNALSQGFTPSTTFISQATTFQINDQEEYTPANYKDNYPNKEISMIHAISLSDNIYAVKTHLFLGMDTLKDSLQSFGIQHPNANPSDALGTVDVSILELTSIYNTFAGEGLYQKPQMISHIIQNDEVILQNEDRPKRLLERDETLILSQLLTSTYDEKNIAHSMPTLYGSVPPFTTAVKSGTSDFDAVVVGYNPEYTIGIWSGFDDNRQLDPMYFETAKKIYKDCFTALYEDDSAPWYSLSEDLMEVRVNPISGKEDANGSIYWYKR